MQARDRVKIVPAGQWLNVEATTRYGVTLCFPVERGAASLVLERLEYAVAQTAKELARLEAS